MRLKEKSAIISITVMITVYKRLKERWNMNGKRYSRQRELIFEALKHTTEHPTAEMVYQWLKPENPNLSLGTVYRNLNLLADEGRITRMAFPVEPYSSVSVSAT